MKSLFFEVALGAICFPVGFIIATWFGQEIKPFAHFDNIVGFHMWPERFFYGRNG
jgi:hypothetical protein